MRLRTLAVAATLGATLGVSACSDGPGAGVGTTPAPDQTSVTSASPSPSPVATRPAGECLTGRYALVRFVAVAARRTAPGRAGT